MTTNQRAFAALVSWAIGVSFGAVALVTLSPMAALLIGCGMAGINYRIMMRKGKR